MRRRTGAAWLKVLTMKRIRWAPVVAAVMMIGAGGVLSACSHADANYPVKDKDASAPRMENEKRETVFGTEGLFGNDKKNKDDQGSGTGIGVNSFLWRASLDTLGFMPIASADPFGGTILTDWYQMPETPNERFKLNVFILGRTLRADGVKVSVFKQVHDAGGQWTDVKVDPKMGSDLENAILTRARQLRIVSE
jgi:hypothetical protein